RLERDGMAVCHSRAAHCPAVDPAWHGRDGPSTVSVLAYGDRERLHARRREIIAGLGRPAPTARTQGRVLGGLAESVSLPVRRAHAARAEVALRRGHTFAEVLRYPAPHQDRRETDQTHRSSTR